VFRYVETVSLHGFVPEAPLLPRPREVKLTDNSIVSSDLWYRYDMGWNALATYTGKQCEPETGLYFFPYRYYAPTTARWAWRDPLGMVDGPNVYGYVNQSPLIRSDGLGLVGGPWPDPTRTHPPSPPEWWPKTCEEWCAFELNFRLMRIAAECAYLKRKCKLLPEPLETRCEVALAALCAKAALEAKFIYDDCMEKCKKKDCKSQ